MTDSLASPGRASGVRFALLFAVILLSFAVNRQAFAHAEPATAKPGDGAVLNEPPTSYELSMTQEMARQAGANDIDVFDASGREVTTVAAVIDASNRRKLTVALPGGLPTGTYRVVWKTLSADDGDSATGSLSFTIDPAGVPNAGKGQLKEAPSDPNAATTPSGSSGALVTPPKALSGNKPSITWVTTVAVGFITFALGVGATYIALDRKK